jgi:hypothetical protein
VLATNHVLAGAALGHLIGAPLPAVAAGLVSHIVMDAIPHWGGNGRTPITHRIFLRVAKIDGIVLLLVAGMVLHATTPSLRAAVAAGAIAALAPDLDKPWEYFFGALTGHRPLYGRRFVRFNVWLQREAPSRWWVEALTAAALLFVLATLLL